ncbi:MAG: YidC/Oxa1 family membrane protein insertase [Lachnospiraceae bacterium]|nr:YidC/Oxa1 family membrane protein insertase [Lachnospiraceae bacterium]
MSSILLATSTCFGCNSGPFKWIMDFMGLILNWIFQFVNLFGIQNIALCIFLFTFVTKMLMLPLTIKQQKFTKLQKKMSPELNEIQKKYKGKKDEESLRRQQAETSAVYAKYGTSPMGGCLPLLITLPIMFALYQVIYNIPFYIDQIGDWYTQIANAIQSLSSDPSVIATNVDSFVTATLGNGAQSVPSLVEVGKTYLAGSPEYSSSLVDILVKFTEGNWDSFFAADFFKTLATPENIAAKDAILSANSLFGLSILDTPMASAWYAYIIPILAAATQFIQGKLQNLGSNNTPVDNNNPAAGSSKAMTTIFPLMSGVFCIMFPIGIGLYWIASALVTIVQSLFINKYLDKPGRMEEIIDKNQEKSAKKNEKLGIKHDDKMAAVARTNTKSVTANNVRSIETTDNSYKKNKNRKSSSGTDYKKSEVSYKASSIAANANLLLHNYDDSKEESESQSKPENKDKTGKDVDKEEFKTPENTSSDKKDET